MKKFLALALVSLTFSGVALAANETAGVTAVKDPGAFTLTIKDHKFTPATLEVPAGQKIKIRVVNEDYTAEEFESEDLDREKVIGGNSEGLVIIGPLKPGTYKYIGEFNEDTARGEIVAK